MLALTGTYDNGNVRLEKQPPVSKGKIIILFPDEPHNKKTLSREEKESLFNKFSGCVDREIDVKKEKMEYLDERY